MALYDLHLHSTYSDGDEEVSVLVKQARQRGIAGCSLTDHNGIWGTLDAAAKADEHGMAYVAGIEISTHDREYDADVHVLGYARAFKTDVLDAGLAQTRAGYEARVREMVELCQRSGYDKITFAAIEQRRRGQQNPSYISYDVARLLTKLHGLSVAAARALTVAHGACYVPYGDWALSPQAAIDVIHQSGGLAVLAHPGIITHEYGREAAAAILAASISQGIDGLEVLHPFHSADVIEKLAAFAGQHKLLVTGGSDWHGPNRYHEEAFGNVGMNESQWEEFQSRLA